MSSFHSVKYLVKSGAIGDGAVGAEDDLNRQYPSIIYLVIPVECNSIRIARSTRGSRWDCG
jgi:hypothetical protein